MWRNDVHVSLFALAWGIALSVTTGNVDAHGGGHDENQCLAPEISPDFERVPVVTGLTGPQTFEQADDGQIYLIERGGAVKVYDPVSAGVSLIGQLSVGTSQEFGLLGLALDPSFLTSGWVYLYYTQPTLVSRLSRFTISAGSLDLDSELPLLEVPHVPNYHVGGDLEYGPDGNLYLATGANDFAFTELYFGCDESNSGSDCAKVTSSNTSDLRGKILRIKPRSFPENPLDPAYTVPSGNLFGGSSTRRPEIYSMGHRNPFRFGMDSVTGALYVAEVGTEWEEINLITGAGYYGWPLFEGPSGSDSPVAMPSPPSGFSGDSLLPASRQPWIAYNNTTTTLPIPGLPTSSPPGRAIMAGPVYHYDASSTNLDRLPASYDGHLFFWDFSKGNLWNVSPSKIVTEFVPGLGFGPAANFGGANGTIELGFGTDGQMYVLELWSGTLWAVNHVAEMNRTPVLEVSSTALAGPAPLSVTFSAVGSSDPDGDPFVIEWDFNSDGIPDAVGASPVTEIFTTLGEHIVSAKITDSQGSFATHSFHAVVGNSAPIVDIVSPRRGGFFQWGDTIDFEVAVNDVEDGSTLASDIDCTRVNVAPSLGHDGHDHGGTTQQTCAGTLQPLADDGHGDDARLYYLLRTSYEDTGAAGAPPVEGTDIAFIHPKRREAEFAEPTQGVTRRPNTDPWTGGAEVVSDIDDHDYVVLEQRDLHAIDGVRYRVASATSGGNIELRLNSAAGPLVVSTTIENTGGFESWQTVGSSFSPPSGRHDLFFVFRSADANKGEDLFDLNWIEFEGSGIGTDAQSPDIKRVYSTEARTVQVEFTEAVQNASAENTGHYSLPGLSIHSATLEPDERTVTLGVSSQTPGSQYTLSVSQLEDLAGNEIGYGTSASYHFGQGGLTEGLRAHWTFDNNSGTTTRDESQNAASATLLGGAAFDARGAQGDSLRLFGGDEWVNTPNLSFAGDFTVAAWVRLDPGISNADSLMGQEGAGQDLNFYAGKFRLYAPGDEVVATTPTRENVWTHVAVTRSGSSLRLYMDGELDATGNWSGAFSPKALGRGQAGFFAGRMDDVRLYDRAVVDDEVHQLAANLPTAALDHYRFDDNVGSVARDTARSTGQAQLGGGPRFTLGVRQGAIAFDGVNDLVDIPDRTFDGPFSISAWVKLTGSITNRDAIVGQAGRGQDINFYAGRVRYYTGFGDALVATQAVSQNRWTHIAFTRDDENLLSLYINGEFDTSANYAGSFQPRMVGRGNAGFLEGELDDLRLYDVALSAAQVEALATPGDSAPLLHYSMDGAPGAVFTDSLRQENDGIRHGGSGVSLGRSGRYSAHFDGSRKWIDIPDLELASDFTVAASVFPYRAPGNRDALLGQVGPGQDISFDNQRLRFHAPGDRIVSSQATNALEWQHVAITRRSGSLTLLHDGEQDSVSGCDFTEFVPKAAGRGNAGFFHGQMDELRVYDRAVRSWEVQNMASQRGEQLRAYWPMNEGSGGFVADLGLYGNSAYAHGTTTTTLGREQQARVFDGVDDWLDIPNLTFHGDFTIVAWARLDAGISNQDAIVGQQGSGQDINFYAGRLRFYTGSGDAVVADTVTSPNVWNQYAVVREGTQLRLYVDGVLDAVGFFSGTFAPQAIGVGNAGYFGGRIDEVRLYERALSAEEL